MPLIRDLQRELPWGAHEYNMEFQHRIDPHRDAEHAFVHVTKAAGRLADIVDDFSHCNDEHTKGETTAPTAGKYLADLVICAARMANTWPGGAIDLEDAIRARLAEKFPVRR